MKSNISNYIVILQFIIIKMVMLMRKKNEKNNHRIFYQTLMTFAFSLNIDHRYHYYLKPVIYIFIINWTLMLILSPFYIIWIGKQTLATSMKLELLQYIICGMLYTFIYVVFLFKKQVIISNYTLIETDFRNWSLIKGTNQNRAYEQNIRNVRKLTKPYIVMTIFTLFGPLLSTINDIGKKPIDHHSHFLLFWPKLVEVNEFVTYGIIYSLQMGISVILNVSLASFNIGLIVIFNELNIQFQMLLDELRNAFKYRTEEKFKKLFIDCVYHHQLIIKFLDDFKSYFKWIMFLNIICIQLTMAGSLYLWIKIDSSFGYKMKVFFGTLLFTLGPLLLHCEIGENIRNMHTRLADHLYSMTWYDMPTKNKQLFVIMLQRTQKDISIHLGKFSNLVASRSLIVYVFKQTWTILNVLLKTK